MATERSGNTGEKCLQSGVYRCQTHSKSEIPLAKGDTFPPCREVGNPHGTTWLLVRKA